MKIATTKNLRAMIENVAADYACAGEDWSTALLAGAPTEIYAPEARRIADWLNQEADETWGRDWRHHSAAAEILALVEA